MQTESLKKMKTVSIVMCTYNGEQYLREQMDSLLAQTYPIREIIVQDDVSTDSTWKILTDYATKHPDVVKATQNKERKGYRLNFMSALLKATGDYVAISDQDDIWLPEKIEVLVKEIGDAALVFHDSVLFSTSANDMGRLHRQGMPAHMHPIATLLKPQGYGHQLMFRKDLLERLVLFANHPLSYDYFIQMLAGTMIGGVKYVDKVLVRWRRFEGATTFHGFNREKGSKIQGYIDALKTFSDKKRKHTVKAYFALCLQVSFCDEEACRVAGWMSQANGWSVLKASAMCLKHRHELCPDAHGTIQIIRALFMPLAFFRDYAGYILED